MFCFTLHIYSFPGRFKRFSSVHLEGVGGGVGGVGGVGSVVDQGNYILTSDSVFVLALQLFNPFTPDGAKSKTVKFYKITNWGNPKNKQHHSKALLNSFRSH